MTGKLWALKYDAEAKQVVANRPIAGPTAFPNPPIMAIGSDERGEIYLGDSFGNLWTARAK